MRMRVQKTNTYASACERENTIIVFMIRFTMNQLLEASQQLTANISKH